MLFDFAAHLAVVGGVEGGRARVLRLRCLLGRSRGHLSGHMVMRSRGPVTSSRGHAVWSRGPVTWSGHCAVVTWFGHVVKRARHEEWSRGHYGTWEVGWRSGSTRR
eukprot:3939670-Rhodomonas_salina.1